MSLKQHVAGRMLALGLLALAAAPVAAAQGGVYLEQNGLVAVQFESAPSSGWLESTQTGGFTGQNYRVWTGPNLFSQPGVAGVFSFDFHVTNPGTYILYIRNRHENPDPTEENDVWVKMDNGHWDKVFSNNYTSLPYVGNWTWESRTEAPGFPQASFWLSAGTHRISYAARSFGFKMDRFHLARPGQPNANDLNVAESVRVVGTTYGQATTNSTGQVGMLEGRGSSYRQFNNLTLRASSLPPSSLGVFLVSRQQGFTANPGGSQGNLLLGNNFARYTNVVTVSPMGVAQMPVNAAAIPVGMGNTASAMPGETWNFQFLHREQGSTNMTRGLAVTFE